MLIKVILEIEDFKIKSFIVYIDFLAIILDFVNDQIVKKENNNVPTSILKWMFYQKIII